MPTRKWQSEFLVNTTTAGNQGQPAVTALADGGFVIAWRDDGPADSLIRFQRYGASGVKVGGEITELILDLDQAAPAIVQLSDGNLWIVREDLSDLGSNDIQGIVQSLSGASVRQQSGGATSNNEVRPAVASLGFGGAVTVWQDDASNGGDIFMRGFDATGAETIVPTLVNGGASLSSFQAEPDVAANKAGTRFAVVWTDSGLIGVDIRARVFDTAGTEVAAEFTVNAVTAGLQLTPRIAWLDNRRFVVTWGSFDSPPSADTDQTAIKYAIYSDGGVLQGTERLANSTVSSFQSDSAITALPDGGFAIAWRDLSATGGDTSSAAIRLQAFDGVGDKRGGEILVNTTTAGEQSDVALAALADGRVVVTWNDFSASGGDTSGGAIRAQIVDPRDGLVTGTGGADALYGHDLVNDEISGYDGADSLFGLRGNDALYAGAGADSLDGGEGDDELRGGPGNDTATGGLGNDWFFVEEAGDVVNDAAGEGALDRVFTLVSYTLTAGAEIEIFSTDDHAGAAAINLTGNELANPIFGNEGANTLDGKAGADTLTGWGGNDFFYVDNALDVVRETPGAAGGTADRVFASANWTITAGSAVEILSTTNHGGVGAIDFTGNELVQSIFGNAGANILNGRLGSDTLSGLGGVDRFLFNTAIRPTPNIDRIADFALDDFIQLDDAIFIGLALGVLAAGAFASNANSNLAQDASDRIIYNQATGALFFDENGNAAGGNPTQFATLPTALAGLANVDFLVV